MDRSRAGPDVIRDRQRAAPTRRGHPAADRVEEHLRVGVRNRQHGNLQDRHGLGDFEPLGVFGRADPGCQRIARIERHVGYRAALHAMGRTHRAVGIGLVDRIAVIGRIGIHDAANRAVILRELGLQPAPDRAVAGDRDLALDADAEPLERLVVVLCSIVDVDQAGRHVAIALVFDVGRKRGIGRGRAGIAGDRRLLQRGLERFGASQLQALA